MQGSLYHVLYKPKICIPCIQKLEVIYTYRNFDGHTILILYVYNAFFKQVLFQYKGLYDLALKGVFLDIFHQELKQRFRKHLMVIVPSSKKDNVKRGFIPNEEIVKTLGIDIFTGIYKRKEYKQTSQVDRNKIVDILAIKDG
jgi:hypothetical protein